MELFTVKTERIAALPDRVGLLAQIKCLQRLRRGDHVEGTDGECIRGGQLSARVEVAAQAVQCAQQLPPFGQPVGLSFIGRAWTEELLIKFAYAYEQATKHRHPPKFLPTVDLNAP